MVTMMRRLNPIAALMLATLLAAPAWAAPASGNGNGSGNSNANPASATTGSGNPNSNRAVTKLSKDNEVAREAVKKHQALSLEAVTALVAKSSAGRVLDVEMVRLGGVLAYQVTVLEADGRLHKLYYNAGSGILMDDR
jgi:uncharacterized membrane protein YkoI